MINANGSLESQTQGGNQTTYGDDLRNRLQSVTADSITTTYKYDPAGNRVGRTSGSTTVSYLVDPMNLTGYSQVLQETTGSNMTTYTLGGDVIAQAAGSTVQFLIYDGHGSVRNHANSTGALVWFDIPDKVYKPGQPSNDTKLLTYDAWGQECNGLSGDGLYYTGEMYDTKLSMYNLRARWYSPATGRFNAADSFDGLSEDPQSLHRYLYAHCDPINNMDPTGYFNISEINVSLAIRSVLLTMNLTGAAYNAKGVTTSAIDLYNAWSDGDFWRGLPHVVMGAAHGTGLVMNIGGIIAGIQGPPGGTAPALALAGGGVVRGGFWHAVVSNPQLAGWVIDQVGPIAYNAFLVLAAQEHHGIPYENSKYQHEEHELMKQAELTQDDLRKMPENRMLLENHGGRHWNEYHDSIREMMNAGLRKVRGQGRDAARRELNRICDRIREDIKNGTLKPYKNKEVKLVEE